MSERMHLVFCATWCAIMGGILGFAPAETSLSRWYFCAMAASGVGGLMKASYGAWGPKQS